MQQYALLAWKAPRWSGAVWLRRACACVPRQSIFNDILL